MRRERLDLNFGWRYSADFRPEYIRPDFKDTAFRLVDIPHTVAEWRSGAFEGDCRNVTCYRKMFLLPESMKGRRLVLHFEGVMGCAAAFVNGKPVCAHKGGYTPFECDVTEAIGENVRGEEILISVVVDSTEREDTAPYGSAGMIHDGGIYREVWLEATDKEYIAEYQMSTFLEKEQWTLEVSGRLSFPDRREIKVNLYDGEKKLGAKVIFSENHGFSVRWQPALKLEPWTPDTPKLYRVEIAVEDDDCIENRIGFRHAVFRPDGFWLNDVKTVLVGFARSQIYARAGAAAPYVMQKDDVLLLKRLGCNIVRTGGYPFSQGFLDACDELGVMVYDEMPGNGYVGGSDWQDCLIDNLSELVLRDRSRTCVVLWSAKVPYSPEGDALSQRAMSAVRKLDSARQIGGVRSVGGQLGVDEDVFCLDDCSGSDYGLEKKKNIYKPKIPYMIVGHSAARLEALPDGNDRELLDQALAHAKVLNCAMGDSDIIGFFGGDLSDYPVHRGEGHIGAICRSGITDCSRGLKPAAHLYRSQIDDEDVLELFREEGTGKIYAFTNCERVRIKRGGKSVAEYLPAKKQYPNLAHPPVIIDDLIGDQPCVEDGIEHKELANFKALLVSMYKETGLPRDARLKSAASAAVRFKISGEELVRLCDKYAAVFSGASPVTFEGIKKGRPVCVRVLSDADCAVLRVSCDRSELLSDVSYDCLRVELTAEDGSGNILRSRNDAVSVELDGSIEMIGSRLFALSAGTAVFHVRTKGGKGPAKIKITTEALGSHSVDLEVVRTKK